MKSRGLFKSRAFFKTKGFFKTTAVAIVYLLLAASPALSECKTCGITRRENLAKYPPPPKANAQKQILPQKLYKKTTPKRPVTAMRIASYPVIVHPEKTVWLYLSNTDTNRVVCTSGQITYIFTSKEKGVVTEIKDDEAYIKFKSLLDPETGSIKRVKTPTEFYIRCAGETYSFISKPQAIPARTVYLESEKNRATPPEDLIKKDSLDAALVEIIRSVFLDRIPPSWQRGKLKNRTAITRLTSKAKVRITELKTYRIPGIPIIVRVFTISSDRAVQVGEKLLLDPSITKNPVAISIMDHIIRPFDPTRAVIVERMR